MFVTVAKASFEFTDSDGVVTVSVNTSSPSNPSTLKLRKKKFFADNPVLVVDTGVVNENPQ
tara:strand:+ start:1180 stop:1362 length:183 start_codon:yes stop_codon:yes gene_type:complete